MLVRRGTLPQKDGEPMLQAMRGVLSEDPDIRIVPGPDGVYYRGVSLSLSYTDDRSGASDGNCQLVAWNEQADKLSRYQKGDEIEFIGRLHSNSTVKGYSSNLSFTLVHLDESKTVLAAVETLFRDRYIPKTRLSDQIQHAETQKDRLNNQQPEHLLKEATP